jgi:hypothetical protein
MPGAPVLVELGEACHQDRVTLSPPFEEWARIALAAHPSLVAAARRIVHIKRIAD